MSEQCPICQQHLILADGRFHCNHCDRDFVRQAVCPDCGQPVQVLMACGAVDYFCPAGHGLISKKRIIFVPLAVML